MKNLKFILFWISQILSFPLMAQTVSNVQAEQVGKKNVVTYSLDKQADILTFTINGVSFNMVKVAGGTFTMGATAEQEYFADDDETVHKVTLTDYYIGQTEVMQALWTAVMSDNPSYYKGDNRPVEQVSWDDCQTFIEKLNSLLSNELGGKRFALPTEAQWEFAARGGNKSKGYKYAGGNNIGDVAWYDDNSSMSHPVAQKQPNELGLYDMSGNVWEWCKDCYDRYSSYAQTNPQGPTEGSSRVLRGGSWFNTAKICRVSNRSYNTPDVRFSNLGLRLCLLPVSVNQKQASCALPEDKTLVPFTVNGVSFKMVKVAGGTFTMGSTAEQGKDAYYWERPAHQVTLSDYYIGQTEVTQELWTAVMGNNPSFFKGDNLPVTDVSWEDCQTFIEKLNRLLSKKLGGKRFALPTEAQWEFAARGGNKSKGYTYAGSNNLDDVAWYWDYSDKQTHSVAQKQPNELGLYDMSGNVWEWCQDWAGNYSSDAQTNPQGPASGTYRVYRGGRWSSNAEYCRVSYRGCYTPGNCDFHLGLRLCLIP